MEVIGFKQSNQSNVIYTKSYKDGSIISVNIAEEKIKYSDNIRNDRSTICNFKKKENFVVLECVDRLLDLGYYGKNLYLEKDLGDAKDYIDIAIYDKNNPSKIYAIIECKTWGDSFNSALQKAQKDGTQILRYAIQDRHCSYIIIYSSEVSGRGIKREERSIDLTLYTADNRDELFDIWDKTFVDLSFFTQNAYNEIGYSIRKKDLVPISVNDIGNTSSTKSIYNEFKTILRRHSVSDTDNAYNKIFNLFLCKIVDEDEKLSDECMDFQWMHGEDADTVLLRLSDLYKKGMKTKLNLTITDYSEKDLEKAIQRQIPDELKKIFVELRLYKNNEFAFKEVFDKRTFYENAALVKEIVRLIQRKQIKYSTKQQFLGDFFEKLLNMGVKQEVGQYFTPIPIAEFVLRSLPIRSIIERKIYDKQEMFLPYVIDYSCGSGHFLTEAMERIQHFIKNIDHRNLSNAQQKNLMNWNNFAWAKEFVYGIEDDYRLAKTTKVACFLNGDGEANIIYANGLDRFDSKNYWGTLYTEGDTNNKFDIVVANPPYSVADFKDRIKTGDQYFTLYNKCGKDDIECLFVERTGQLLCENGVAGVILPSTFLTATNYSDTRKYLLRTFIVKGICLLGQQTFSATDKSTCVLFLKKLPINDVKIVEKRISNFFVELKDFSYKGNSKIISEYSELEYGLSFQEYCDQLNDGNFAIEEKTKLLIWLLNYEVEIPIIKSGNKEAELHFLGYKHTSKKKYEGIIPYPTGKDHIDTMLFSNDENDIRLDKFILNSFEDNPKLEISEDYKDYIIYKKTTDLIDTENGQYMIITKEFKRIYSDLEFVSLSDESIISESPSSGNTAPQGIDLNRVGEGIPFIRVKHLNNVDENYTVIPKEYISEDNAKKYNLKIFHKGCIVFPKSGLSVNTDKIAILGQDSYVVNHLAVLSFKNEIIARYVYYILKYYKISNLKIDDNTDYPTVNMSTIKRFAIPYSYDIAKKVVSEMDLINMENSKNNIEEDEINVLKKYVYA